MAHLTMSDLILLALTVTLFCVRGDENTIADIWKHFLVVETAIRDDNVADPRST